MGLRFSLLVSGLRRDPFCYGLLIRSAIRVNAPCHIQCGNGGKYGAYCFHTEPLSPVHRRIQYTTRYGKMQQYYHERQVFYMNRVFTREWFRAAGVRAIKTVAQTAVASIGTSAVLGEVDWIAVGSAAVLAGVLSLLTSVAGIPEVQ